MPSLIVSGKSTLFGYFDPAGYGEFELGVLPKIADPEYPKGFVDPEYPKGFADPESSWGFVARKEPIPRGSP
jgi:hypothetical protein